MERFKFRFWDEEKKRMDYRIYVSQEALISPEAKNPLKLLDDSYTAYNPEHAYKNLMQCTGLKDKNGKLIYEGDIVKCDCDLRKIYVITFFRNEFVLMTQWRDANGKIKNQTEQSRFNWQNFCKTDHSNYVVDIIGNIYENEDLLK